jgi:hypothetical protein
MEWSGRGRYGAKRKEEDDKKKRWWAKKDKEGRVRGGKRRDSERLGKLERGRWRGKRRGEAGGGGGEVIGKVRGEIGSGEVRGKVNVGKWEGNVRNEKKAKVGKERGLRKVMGGRWESVR